MEDTDLTGEHKDQVDGVGIIIADAISVGQVTKVLLMQRGPKVRYTGLFENPGGSLEHGETPLEAAIREIWEELGVKPVQIELLFSYKPFLDRLKKDHVFIAVIKDVPRIAEADRGKCVALQWTPISDLSAIPLTRDAEYDFRRLGWLR